MAEIDKLSVQKALDKIRSADEKKSKSVQRDHEMQKLEEEIERMRAQRLRLERRHGGKSD